MTSKFSSLSRFFFLVLLTLSATQYIQAQNATVFFATDSYEISAVEMAKLDSILAHIDQSQISGIKLVGHTDSRASNAYNIQLSENRVNAVKRYLTSKGVSEFLVTTDFHGESLPVATLSLIHI